MIIKVTPAEGTHITLQTLQQCSPLLILQRDIAQRREFLVFQLRGEVSTAALRVLELRLGEKGATLEEMCGNDESADFSFL